MISLKIQPSRRLGRREIAMEKRNCFVGNFRKPQKPHMIDAHPGKLFTNVSVRKSWPPRKRKAQEGKSSGVSLVFFSGKERDIGTLIKKEPPGGKEGRILVGKIAV